MMTQRFLTIPLLITVMLTLPNEGAFAAKDQDTIPPEILEKMDDDIRSGKRPIIATIHQNDIFGLRENPSFKADFVRFGFDPGKLSTVQIRILNNWIRSGHNTVYLFKYDVYKYTHLLKPVTFEYAGTFASSEEHAYGKLSHHPVNTDCEKVVFHRPHGSGFFSVTNLPKNSTIIAEGREGRAICGSFYLGEGRILFSLPVAETDSRRWTLNFWHWAMGLGVPGAASTDIAGTGSSGLTLEESEKYDLATLKNGDTITGIIANDHFTMKTSYATLTINTDTMKKLVFEGSGNNVDVIRLKVGDKISGVVQDSMIRVILVSGDTVDVDKDKVKQIDIRKQVSEKS